jgi:serine/threonine protein kinase
MQKGDKLGEGAFGVVYAARSPTTERQYAIKRNLSQCDVSFLGAVGEIDLLIRLRDHPYIVSIDRVYLRSPFSQPMSPLTPDRIDQRDGGLHFAFERAIEDMYQYIYGNRNSFDSCKRYMVQTLLAVEYLHAQSIIHRDIKPENILIFPNGTARLCDFGMAKHHTRQGDQSPNLTTCTYRPPEIALQYPHYDYRVDIWSLGCVFFELIARKCYLLDVPDDNDVIISQILGNLSTTLSPDRYTALIATAGRNLHVTCAAYPRRRRTLRQQLGLNSRGVAMFEQRIGSIDSFSDLLSHMLDIDWTTRFTASQCLRHSFFTEFAATIRETRISHPLRLPKFPKLHIRPIVQQEWVSSLALQLALLRDDAPWLTDRILFQSLAVWSRYLDYFFKSKLDIDTLTENVVKARYAVCLYLCLKTVTVLSPPSYAVVASTLDVPSTNIAELEAQIFESELVVDIFEYEIYVNTLYEAADLQSEVLTSTDIDKLLRLFLAPTSDPVSGLDLYSSYRNGKTARTSNI